MPALDRIVPLAASATILVCIPVAPPAHSSSALRVPITQAHGLRVVEREAVVNRYVVRVRAAIQPRQQPYDVFTAADMKLLDSMERVVTEDHFDYDSLLDYDDD